jgi:hypothetical protein
VACWCLFGGGWVLVVMSALGGVPVVTTGGMPRRVGVYIRISVPVCFHSFCSRGGVLGRVCLCVHRFVHRLWITGVSRGLGCDFAALFGACFLAAGCIGEMY